MTIIHDIYGEAEGVEWNSESEAWDQTVNGVYMLRFSIDGWREKVEERWEEDSEAMLECEARGGVELSIGGARSPLSMNRRWAVVERYDLPAKWQHQSVIERAENLTNWVEQFKRPCLIIQRLEQ